MLMKKSIIKDLMPKIKVYTSNTCGYCVMVKKFLTMKGKEYTEINISDEPERQQEAIDLAGVMSVPVTVIDGFPIVGYNASLLSELLSREA